MDIPIQIANMTSPVIVRAEDPWSTLVIATMLLACATIILVIITFFGNRTTNKNTRDSNERLELELKARIRPILQLEFARIHPTQEVRSGKIYKNVRGEIGNLGNVPVRNIKFYYNFGNKKPESLAEIFKNKGHWRKRDINTDFGTIIPESRNSSYKPFSIGEFEYPETEANPLWVVAWIEYKFLDKFNENCIFVFRVNGETVNEDDMIFYSHSDIEEEKHHKKSDDAPIG